MSFGPTAQTSQAMSNLGSTSGFASSTAPNLFSSGTGYFQNLLNGNANQTQQMLAPDINRIRQGEQQTLQSASTLTPRGAGRSGTLFAQPFAANEQIQNLFNPARAGAAGNLESAGSNLFGIGNQSASNLGQLGIAQQAQTNKLWGQLGQGLFGLATLPFGGGTAANGLLGLLGGGH